MTDNKSRYKNYAPFGVRAERGIKVGFHPSLDKTGAMKRAITDAGPGTYDPKFQDCKFKNGINWDMKSKVEEFSKWMGWKNLSVLEKRRFFASLNGPGTHDINPQVFKKQNSSIFKDVHFTKGRRFTYMDKPLIPSPDRYFQDLKQLSTIEAKSFSEVPTFEWDGFVSRFRYDSPPTYLLPPNLYDVVEHDGKCTADLCKKKGSTRGPCDMCSGPRDQTTLTGFYAPSNVKLPDWFFVPPSRVDELLYSSNLARNGKFFKEEQYPKRPTKRHMLDDLSLAYRNPDEPGPATYDMRKFKGIIAHPPGLYPFDICKAQSRPHPGKLSIFPGPGRFTPKVPRCMKQKRNSCVFLSKYPRIKIYPDLDYRAF